ncbi:hypothetical protein PANO111632_19365 [Paracoccus nototheniae]|uniref:Uncharacterized protein n=1 Tax=Paracoccus nototheniae TaxID=2489002 RepID=A0ABW4DQS0_9RHOB|nr:hypothetical protein [Paracoccus nototheniae]
MKLAYVAMGMKVAQAVMKTRSATTVSRGAGGLASGIGTAVMLVAAAGLLRKLFGGR